MKTIVAGNREILKEYKYFKCIICGWVGKAEKEEYQYCGNQIDGDNWKVVCPCCGKTAWDIQNEKELKLVISQEAKNDAYEDQWYG